ncbi:MAG: glycosyltransferase family 4 protein [Chloroflexota bacterium]|nr:MAG: glycosyltransferase family 4 protein [Chloroflexota bacterium]
MNVLFVTAYFPPCQRGYGYMKICESVADGLAGRGHSIAVLTSTFRDGEEFKPYPVHRLLAVDPDWQLPQSAARQFFFGRRSREKMAVRNLKELVAAFRPDIIFIWHANSLSRRMLQTAENLPQIKTVYYFANYYPEQPDEYIAYWSSGSPPGLAGPAKKILAKIALKKLAREGKPIALKFEHSISVSDYVRRRLLNQELIGPDAVVAHNGVDLGIMATATRKPLLINGAPLKCLIAGRVAPEKGIHTALQALQVLRAQNQLQPIQLAVIGDGQPEYKRRLKQFTVEHQLQKFVRFEPPVPQQEMPGTLMQYDVLLFPSVWDEPLSCTMLEAMASELLVVGTTTGGSREVLFHEQTGLVFQPNNPSELAEQLARVQKNPEIVGRLGKAGRRRVEEQFNMQRTVESVERYLLELVGDRS